MLKKIKTFFQQQSEWKETKKALTFLLLTRYNHLLQLENSAKMAEKQAYEATKVFRNAFHSEDLQKLRNNISIVTDHPKLPEDFYNHISKRKGVMYNGK